MSADISELKIAHDKASKAMYEAYSDRNLVVALACAYDLKYISTKITEKIADEIGHQN